MEVDCEGCAGCCIDWRPLTTAPSTHERGGPGEPLDDAYNLVPLTRADVREFVESGLADALRPRLWKVDSGGVTVDGHRLAAIDGRPIFYLGLRTPPKPVGPFDTEARWLNTCAFLDPTTLQCRIHGEDVYPSGCETYPGHNLALEAETECERVERATGDRRLLDDEPPPGMEDATLGPGAVGHRLFVLPDPDPARDVVTGSLTPAARATFVAAAAAGAPGTTEHDLERLEDVRQRALATSSWAGTAADQWTSMADTADPNPTEAERIEVERGAPPTPGWD
jgi:Fe-S-cluster containining protein